MEDDIKYAFQKIQDAIDEIKRNELYKLQEKLSEFNAYEFKTALREIKEKLGDIESKIQK